MSGRVAGRVRERSGLGDRADECCDATVVTAQLEDLLDHGAVLALELADAPVRALFVQPLLDVDEQAALAVGARRAGDPTVQAVQRNRTTAAGKPNPVRHLGDRPHLRVLVVVLRDEQHAVLVADVDRQSHVHVREDDDVVQGHEQQTHLVFGLVLAHHVSFIRLVNLLQEV